MANDANNGVLRTGAFSLSWSGGLEYGSREMTFDGAGKFYFAKGDTINDDTQTGVGVFVLNVQNRDLEELKGVAQALCDRDIQTGGPETHDPAATFSVVCMEGGKAVSRSGSLRLIPERFRHQVFDAPRRLSERAWTEGGKLIKLDFTTESVEHKDGRYIVSVRFINSGDRWIKFKTPDQWKGTSLGGRLGVGAVSRISRDGRTEKVEGAWAFGLDGQTLSNQDRFPDGIVTLKPDSSETLKFQTKPDYQAVKGNFEFSGIAFMRIEYEGYGWGLSSQVDFKPIKAQITIDRDYPSTPEERQQWEARHRADMSFQPVKPGGTFPEDGLYRAVQMSGGVAVRSLQLMPFKAGDVATTDSATMFTASASGAKLNGPAQWVWTASAPTPVKQWSPDVIDGTQHHSAAGEVCPRSGRWLARVHTGDWKYRYDLAGIVTRKRGERMPDADDGSRHGGWEWLGV